MGLKPSLMMFPYLFFYYYHTSKINVSLPTRLNEDVHNIQWKTIKISPIGPIITISKLKTIIFIYWNVCCYTLLRAYLVFQKHFHTIWLLHFIHNTQYKSSYYYGWRQFYALTLTRNAIPKPYTSLWS